MGTIETEANPNLVGVNVTPNEVQQPVQLDSNATLPNKEVMIFVLGGPGSGKGTQCSMIVEQLGFCHISTGDLLDTEIKSGSENGTMIQNLKSKGELVPTGIVVKLLMEAMKNSTNKKFIIDGFPRNMENLAAAQKIMKLEPVLVLFLECSQEVMIERILGRKQKGRVDDNSETIKRRIEVYCESTLPVISYYRSKGMVEMINGEKPVEEVFDAVKAAVSKLKLGISRKNSQEF
ncbi:UMP-CMP kinase 3-like isoform X1 [Rhododendron vialii]|uniref:UMP-CMP kinase 3-like isoform X1 n=1 Tax=Rhododendron vialii TaxID=182163 RepID=UPI00265F9218|nr:UMP-CMP kinase 3-like isoform X1 [Rhododendron vialii]